MVNDLRRQIADTSTLRQMVSDGCKSPSSLRAGGDDPLAGSEVFTVMLRYYRLLCSMETRFEADDLRLQFPWKDAFQAHVKQGESDVRFERAAMLWNIASLMSLAAMHMDRRDLSRISFSLPFGSLWLLVGLPVGLWLAQILM